MSTPYNPWFVPQSIFGKMLQGCSSGISRRQGLRCSERAHILQKGGERKGWGKREVGHQRLMHCLLQTRAASTAVPFKKPSSLWDFLTGNKRQSLSPRLFIQFEVCTCKMVSSHLYHTLSAELQELIPYLHICRAGSKWDSDSGQTYCFVQKWQIRSEIGPVTHLKILRIVFTQP